MMAFLELFFFLGILNSLLDACKKKKQNKVEIANNKMIFKKNILTMNNHTFT